MDNLSIYSSLLLSIVGIIFVIFLAYFGTKWLAKRYNGGRSGKYIKILEQKAIGQNKSLIVTQMGDRVFLLGVTNHGVETICSLGMDELPEQQTDGEQQDFYTIFTDMVKKQVPVIGKAVRTLRVPGGKK